MTSGEKVIASFRKRLGVHEIPMGSNDDGGGPITRWNGRWNMRRVPWCGTSSDGVYDEAGVDDGGLGSPSTFQIVENARREGRLRSRPVPGCYAVWRPGSHGHVEIVIRQLTSTAARTIGGNTGDAVREHDRDIRDAFFVVPPALEEKPKPVFTTVYWWEDPKAEPVRHKLRNTVAAREADIDEWVAAGGQRGHVRRGKLSIRRHGKWFPVFTWWSGPRKRSPDFPTEAKRDANYKKVSAERPGHILRKRSKRVPVN